MEGHQQAQERVSNPALVWLRSVVLAINEAGELDRALTATDLHGLCEGGGHHDSGAAAWWRMRARARRLSGPSWRSCFGDRRQIEVDAFDVTREERYVARENSSDGGNFKSKTYTVTRR